MSRWEKGRLALVALLFGILFKYAIPVGIPANLFQSAQCSAALWTIQVGLLTLTVWVGLIAVVTRGGCEPPQGGRPLRFGGLFVRLLLYMLPCLAVWGLYLLAFFPGFMTGDSIDQWGQCQSLVLSDWHPAFHTLSIWLLTRLWPSPAVVGLAQILALGFIFACGMATFDSLGVRRRVLLCLTVVFALMPVNGLFAVTLWKDIPYGITLLALTVLLLRVCEEKMAWFRSSVNLALLAVTLACTWLFRHHGPAVLTASIVALMWSFPRAWLRILAVAAASIGIVALIRGPGYTALKVQRGYGNADLLPLHHVAAVVHHEGRISAADRQFLQRILPMEEFKSKYSPHLVDPLAFKTSVPIDYAFTAAHRRQLIAVWFRVMSQNPGIILRHQLSMSSLVWSVRQQPGNYTFVSTLGICQNPFGLASAPVLPRLQAVLRQFAEQTMGARWNWLFYRGALFMYGSVFICTALAFRTRSLRPFVPAVPLLSNALAVALTIPAQDARYTYPTILTAFLFVPYLALHLRRRRT